MEINLGDERVMVLHAKYSADQIREKAMAKRNEIFGLIAKLIQRVQPEDIKISTFQKRLEPFWFVVASSRYVYDRRHKYRVEVAPKVHAVTVHGNKYSVMGKGNNAIELEAMDHCTEEFKRELIVDAFNGNVVDFKKYLSYPKSEVPDIAALKNDGTIVVPPEILSSFVVRKMVLQLIKTIQADAVNEENINISEVMLFYRPVFAVEYFWKDKNKKKVVEFDALTGEAKLEEGAIKKQVTKVLENNAFFDFSADAAGTLIPGANLVVKLGRMAATKAIQ
jgi:hypothetical protein